MSRPTQFKPELFKGQLYLVWSLIVRNQAMTWEEIPTERDVKSENSFMKAMESIPYCSECNILKNAYCVVSLGEMLNKTQNHP